MKEFMFTSVTDLGSITADDLAKELGKDVKDLTYADVNAYGVKLELTYVNPNGAQLNPPGGKRLVISTSSTDSR